MNDPRNNKLPGPPEPFGHKTLEDDFADSMPLGRIMGGATLSDLSGEYEFFTHAPLGLAGMLEHDIIAEYQNLTGSGKRVFAYGTPCPLFSMHAVFAASVRAHPLKATECGLLICDKDYWPGLRDFIGTAGTVDRRAGTFSRVISQQITVCDAAALVRMSVVTLPVPSVTVTTFTADTNKFYDSFEPALNSPVDRPRLVRHGPRPETVALGRATLSRAPRPHQAASAEIGGGDAT